MKGIVGLTLLGAVVVLGLPDSPRAGELELDETTTLSVESLAEPVGPPKPVVVVNDRTQPVPVTGTVNIDTAAFQPFQEFLNTNTPPLVVPEGKRLVIEYVSGSLGGSLNCAVGTGLLRTTVFVDGKEEKTVTHILPVSERPSPLTAVLGLVTRIHADPGTQVRALVETNPNNCGAGLVMILSGHLEDVP